MFSFSIWNRQSKSLYLARDRFGEKPLYYSWIPQNASFVFGSDLIFDKLFKNIKFELNDEALNDLLHLNYINNNYSILRMYINLILDVIQKYNLKNQSPKINIKKYWKLENINYKKNNLNHLESVNQLDIKLSSVVKDQIFADVEVGTFLSGGIDLSLITAKAQEVSSKKLKLFVLEQRIKVMMSSNMHLV